MLHPGLVVVYILVGTALPFAFEPAAAQATTTTSAVQPVRVPTTTPATLPSSLVDEARSSAASGTGLNSMLHVQYDGDPQTTRDKYPLDAYKIHSDLGALVNLNPFSSDFGVAGSIDHITHFWTKLLFEITKVISAFCIWALNLALAPLALVDIFAGAIKETTATFEATFWRILLPLVVLVAAWVIVRQFGQPYGRPIRDVGYFVFMLAITYGIMANIVDAAKIPATISNELNNALLSAMPPMASNTRLPFQLSEPNANLNQQMAGLIDRANPSKTISANSQRVAAIMRQPAGAIHYIMVDLPHGLIAYGSPAAAERWQRRELEARALASRTLSKEELSQLSREQFIDAVFGNGLRDFQKELESDASTHCWYNGCNPEGRLLIALMAFVSAVVFALFLLWIVFGLFWARLGFIGGVLLFGLVGLFFSIPVQGETVRSVYGHSLLGALIMEKVYLVVLIVFFIIARVLIVETSANQDWATLMTMMTGLVLVAFFGRKHYAGFVRYLRPMSTPYSRVGHAAFSGVRKAGNFAGGKLKGALTAAAGGAAGGAAYGLTQRGNKGDSSGGSAAHSTTTASGGSAGSGGGGGSDGGTGRQLVDLPQPSGEGSPSESGSQPQATASSGRRKLVDLE